MNIKEKAEQYARKQWGDYFDSDCEIAGYDLTYGDISVSDYMNGYNEAKRWIPVGERLPEIFINGRINYVLCKSDTGFPFVGQYTGVTNEFKVLGTQIVKCVKDWREI